MKRLSGTILFGVLLTVGGTALCAAADASFSGIRVPDAKGREIKAVLVFSDTDKAIEVRPAKGAEVKIPYAQIDKCSYEFTFALGFTGAKTHWLQIHYHDQTMPHTVTLQLEKKHYVDVLDAVKAHTGNDAEILGNANKTGYGVTKN